MAVDLTPSPIPQHRGTVRSWVIALGLSLVAWSCAVLLIGGSVTNPDNAWTIVLLLAVLTLPVWCCFRRVPEFDLFQPGTVMACFAFFYIVIPAFHVWVDLDYHSDWMDPTWPSPRVYHIALILCVLSLLGFGVGYRFLGRPHHAQQATDGFSRVPLHWRGQATALAVALLMIGFPFRVYHLLAFGGLTRNLLLFLSPSYMGESTVKIGGVPSLLEGFFDWGALLLLFRAVVTGRHRLLSLGIASVAMILAYLLSGKRSAVFPFLFLPVTWLHYLRQRISVRRGLAYLAVAFVLLTFLLFMRTVGPLLAFEGFSVSAVPADVALEPGRFYIRSPELAVFDMTMLAVQDRPQLLREVGGRFWGGLRYNVAPAGYIIPRFFWPGKPVFQDLGQVFYQHSVDTDGQENTGFSVGIIGGLYLFSGVLGLLLGMVVIGALFRLLYEWLAPWKRDFRAVFLYGIALYLVFHFLRFGNLGFTIVYFIQFELVGVAVAFLALKPAHRPRDRHPVAATAGLR